MVTASHILGDQVGSTAPVFLAFLALPPEKEIDPTEQDRRHGRKVRAHA